MRNGKLGNTSSFYIQGKFHHVFGSQTEIIVDRSYFSNTLIAYILGDFNYVTDVYIYVDRITFAFE